MARAKRTSSALEKAARRAASMASIDPNLDLGNGLTLPAFSTVIETMRAQETAYNSALSSLDKLYREMLETERELSDLTEHMLLGVATKYGKSSVEYEMAGGVPKNQHRKGFRGESLTSDSESPILAVSAKGENSANGNLNGKPTIDVS